MTLAAISPSETLESSTTIYNSTSLSLTHNSTPSNAGDLRVFVNPVGHSLTNKGFFVPVLASLDYVACFPSTSPVDGSVVRPADSGTWIEFRDVRTQPRMEAPFFEYPLIVKAFGELPGYMALLGDRSEANIVMLVDRVNVGDGWLRKGGSRGVEV